MFGERANERSDPAMRATQVEMIDLEGGIKGCCRVEMMLQRKSVLLRNLARNTGFRHEIRITDDRVEKGGILWRPSEGA